MSKEKDLLKEILANTKAIMAHLKISSSEPNNLKPLSKSAQGKKVVAKKNK